MHDHIHINETNNEAHYVSLNLPYHHGEFDGFHYTWVPYRRDISKLERFNQIKLCHILQNIWKARITKKTKQKIEVLLRVKMESLESIMTRDDIDGPEHLARMPDISLLKNILFSELASGKGPRHRFQNEPKSAMLRKEFDPVNWETETAERNNWRRVHEKIL